MAWVEWLAGRAVVRDLAWGADDAAILAAMAEAGKVGIDCPLGWPDAFLAFVVAHQGGTVPIPRGIRERGWRQPLTMRVTDLVVRQETRLIPLSVSADRLGHVAMRCACLLAQFAQEGHAGKPGQQRHDSGGLSCGVAEGLGIALSRLQAARRYEDAGEARR